MRRLSQGYVCLKFEFGADRAVADKLQAGGTPMILFLTREGRVIERASGFHTPAELARLMKRHLR